MKINVALSPLQIRTHTNNMLASKVQLRVQKVHRRAPTKYVVSLKKQNGKVIKLRVISLTRVMLFRI